MYGYKCEYCDGVVKEKLVKKEVIDKQKMLYN